MIGAETLMQAAERVLVGNVNLHTTQERQRDRRIIATHEWGHFLVDLDHERKLTNDNWAQILDRSEDHQDFAQGQPAHQRAGIRLPQAGHQPAQDQGRH
jgi:hypothetical protein